MRPMLQAGRWLNARELVERRDTDQAPTPDFGGLDFPTIDQFVDF